MSETSPRSPTYPSGSKPRRSVRMMAHMPDDDSSSDEETHRQVDEISHTRQSSYANPNTNAGPGASRLASIVSSSAIPKARSALTTSLSQRLPEASSQGGLTHLIAPHPQHPGLSEQTSFTNSNYSDDLKSEPEDDEDEARGELPRTLSAQTNINASEERERLEWRSMLASVLSGDVLRGESSRIGLDKPGDEVFRKKLGDSLWWQIRARLRSRSEVEEKRRTEERRSRVVDPVLEELEGFKVQLDPPDSEGNQPEHNALEQVTAILSKLDVVEALYPHQAAVRSAKSLFDAPALQNRVDALTAWSTVVTSLQAQLAVLQKWTGSEDLDVTKPNTTKERALVGKNRYHPLDTKGIAQAQAMDQAADDSTFIERVMKEDNVQRTFQKRVFHDLNVLVMNAKATVVDFLPVFEDLKLPDFRYEIVRLIGFPGRLIIEMLKVRLDAAGKLVDPNPIVINDMIYNLRVTISLAVLIKRQYLEIVETDPEKRWVIPPCLTPDYDMVLLNGLRMFFKLLHLKLKDGDKAIYFRETEVLEDEWEFLCEAAEAVDGGDSVVAEHFCSLTNKLMVRVCKSFQKQLLSYTTSSERGSTAAAKRAREEDLIAHFGKMLDTARMRYRKLQRFARRLAQRFDNSAEYKFPAEDIDKLVDVLQATDHFIVYTSVFEDTGQYIVASGSLWNDPDAVRRHIRSAFSADYVLRPGAGGARIDTDDDPDEDREGSYVLVLSPTLGFAWTGGLMTVDMDLVDLEMSDNRIRLIADGPSARLATVKQAFESCLVGDDVDIDVTCVVQQQAHLPRIQKELLKISRSTYRLSESFIQSASLVHASLRGSPGSQDLIENWYLFASDHGRRVAFQIEDSALERFSRLLMRLGISWVAFICDSCDPTDRKTFRWTVQALDYALKVTSDHNILHLESSEFSLLRKSVASLISLLISHFDILGARSSMEAKREAERIAAMRRLQKLQENIDDDDLSVHTAQNKPANLDNIDRSIRLIREERLRLIAEIEEKLAGHSNEARLVGQVLDEEVAEDRSLVFLAASSSNIALRWQQGAFIGGGANGNVYMGFNIDSGGVMAVKEIRVQDIHSSPALYKQIKEESDVMSMLSHENIVEYYGIEVHRDRVYIFEEYCEGGSLANLLEHGRIEDEDVIRVYAAEILSGLEYLHSKAVEHRDIKPDNILLSAGSHVKLVDFGAAKVIAKGNKTIARTRAIKQGQAKAPGAGGVDAQPGNLMSLAGTPMYMAPEVIRSEKRGRLGSPDIWSMGCVVLEIATGRKPWSNLDNEWAIMFHIGISTQHPPLPEPDQLSELGIDFIEKCLTLDPLERPTAAELWHHPWLSVFMDNGYAEGDEYIPGDGEEETNGDDYGEPEGEAVEEAGHVANKDEIA